MVALALMIPSAAAAADTTPAARESLVSFFDGQLGMRSDRSSATDPLYFEGGLWQTTNTVCWACNNGGPATTAAALWRASGRSRSDLFAQAKQTVDTAIAQRQGANGVFVPPVGDGQYASPGVASVVFSVELGTTYLLLEPGLDADTKARWRGSLAAAAGYLITNGDVYWYANGNVALGNAELLYIAWRVTGDAKFKTAYENAFAFLLSPPQDKWPGRGLRVVTEPTRADGADGAGYLTETGPGGTGFDPEYTMLQLEIATRLYLLSGDPRALRLANLEINMLLPRVGSDYMLDASNGTRHTQSDRHVPFMTPAFAALAWIAGRSDLQPHVLAQLTAIETQYQQSWNLTNEVFLRGLGNDLSVIMMAADRDPDILAPTLATSAVSF